VNISVTKWSLNGTFLGLSDLEEILPCSMPRKLMRVGRHFGTNFRLKCDIDFTDINKPYQFEFLHPFLSYNDEDSLKKGQYLLYPVPLKVMNFNKNGKKVNQVSVTVNCSAYVSPIIAWQGLLFNLLGLFSIG